MKLDKKEDLADKTDEFERVDDYEQAMFEAKIMAKNYQQNFMREVVVGLIDIQQGDTQSLTSVKQQFGL